jgi:hypothetical protein
MQIYDTSDIRPNRIDRTIGSEVRDPTLLVATSPHGHETILLGQLNSNAYLRIFIGGYRVLVKTSSNTWTTGVGMDDSSAISFPGAIATMVQTLTGKPVTKAGAALIATLPPTSAMAHGAIMMKCEGRMHPLKYITDDLQVLRTAAVLRGV